LNNLSLIISRNAIYNYYDQVKQWVMDDKRITTTTATKTTINVDSE
jgi:hypothetical protein